MGIPFTKTLLQESCQKGLKVFATIAIFEYWKEGKGALCFYS
jgi:hypothetical protein